MNPPPGCFVTVMRPGTALCSPCSFYTSSPPSPFLSSCHLHSHFVILSQSPSSSMRIFTLIRKLFVFFCHLVLCSLHPLLHPYTCPIFLTFLLLLNSCMHIYFLLLWQNILLKRKINKYITTGFKHWVQHFPSYVSTIQECMDFCHAY